MTIRLGANFWNQWTEWPALSAAGLRADQLGYDTLWTWLLASIACAAGLAVVS